MTYGDTVSENFELISLRMRSYVKMCHICHQTAFDQRKAMTHSKISVSPTVTMCHPDFQRIPARKVLPRVTIDTSIKSAKVKHKVSKGQKGGFGQCLA